MITEEQIAKIVKSVAENVSTWTNHDQYEVRVCDDGDGHYDIMGPDITEAGLKEVEQAVRKALE